MQDPIFEGFLRCPSVPVLIGHGATREFDLLCMDVEMVPMQTASKFS
jgi:hypothetical protein